MTSQREHMSGGHSHRAHHHDAPFTVTIRTPGNEPGTFTVEPDEHIETLVRHAVHQFVARGNLTAGRYSLALVHDGHATILTDASRVEDNDITPASDLRLVSREPHVDG